MRHSRTSFSLAVWIACLAVLLGSLGPVFAQAPSSRAGGHWVEVCTTEGTQLVDAGADLTEAPGVPGLGHVLEHCPYCSQHLTGLGLVPAVLPALPALLPAFEVPRLFAAIPDAAPVWVAAQPRAPPSAG